jgi:hypothetical protein
MHRSSESVAALAAALAKAQAELVNPEKSLTATIRSGRPGEGERSFRYAPLASGLDIVRKALGRHEIATVQTTAIDQATGIVTLTTMLAHASGEWIASDWPVCPVAETANPQRMGAALTYARRYALFTLVGIAGEDDLDAPELCAPISSPSSPAGEHFNPARQSWVPPRPGNGRTARTAERAPILDPEQSAAVRERLMAEVAGIAAADLATAWARQSLPAKNTLTPADAKLVEDAFERKLSQLPWSEPAAYPNEIPAVSQAVQSQKTASISDADSGQDNGIDKSVLAVGAPRRYRNADHLRYVAQQPCLICGRKPSDPHHLRHMQPRALGRKSSDEFAVPLCRIHHRLAHRVGNEAAWWKDAGIDPVAVARKLWRETCGTKVEERVEPAMSPQQEIASQLGQNADPIDANAKKSARQ